LESDEYEKLLRRLIDIEATLEILRKNDETRKSEILSVRGLINRKLHPSSSDDGEGDGVDLDKKKDLNISDGFDNVRSIFK